MKKQIRTKQVNPPADLVDNRVQKKKPKLRPIEKDKYKNSKPHLLQEDDLDEPLDFGFEDDDNA